MALYFSGLNYIKYLVPSQTLINPSTLWNVICNGFAPIKVLKYHKYEISSMKYHKPTYFRMIFHVLKYHQNLNLQFLYVIEIITLMIFNISFF